MKLKRCPCGEVPEKLVLAKHEERYGLAWPTCCHTWIVQFYTEKPEDECMPIAINEWNRAPRASDLT